MQSFPFLADADIKYMQCYTIWMSIVVRTLAVKRCRDKSVCVSRQQWDLAVADYMGSVIIKDPQKSGFSLHTLAMKRCTSFANECDSEGRTIVNNNIYA